VESAFDNLGHLRAAIRSVREGKILEGTDVVGEGMGERYDEYRYIGCREDLPGDKFV